MLKNLGISIIKSLIVLVLATFIFSTVALDLPTMIKGLFQDIFQYASPEMQKEVVGKLTQACSGLDEKDYNALQQTESSSMLDLRKIGALCKDYNAGKVNDKEFFFSVIGNAMPSQLELPRSAALDKYNAAINFLNRNKMIYLLLLAVLLALLYLLIMDVKLFAMTLAGISFSMGVLILLPYAAIIVYEKLVGIDTTPILSTILSGSFSFDIKAIISVLLLMILRTYTASILVLGILLLFVGISGKIYVLIEKRKVKSEEKTDKKSEKEEQKKAKTAKRKL